MATITTMQVIDDLDGSADAETVGFGLDGVSYEIDLSQANAQRLRDALAEFVAAARRVGGRRTGRRAGATTSSETARIRAWAQENGYQVSARGRLPAEVIAAYRAAH